MEDILTNPLIIARLSESFLQFSAKEQRRKEKRPKQKKPQQMQTASPQKKQAEEVSVPIPNRMEQVRREAEERRRKQKET